MDQPPPLLPAEVRARIPQLYATQNQPDPLVQAKLFTPWTRWTWFVTEFDGKDTCFGLVRGHEIELGYFSLSELEAVRGPVGLRVERDLHFSPLSLSEVRKGLDGGGPPAGPHSAFNERAASYESQHAGGGGEASPALPSPWDAPRIQMIETRLAENGAAPAVRIRSPRDAAGVLQGLIGDADREHFTALLLNAKHEATHAHIVARGTTQSALVHPREVFKAAVLANATAIIVGHNHPSGDVLPSQEDKATTKRLEAAGKLMGITVLDSLIVGPEESVYTSMTDQVLSVSRRAGAGEPGGTQRGAPTVREAHLEQLCHGLLLDIDEVLERQGEEWWDQTVTSGTHHRNLAEEHLGREPYKPLQDDAKPTPADEPQP